MSDCPSCRGSGWVVKAQDPGNAAVPCPECRSSRLTETLLKKAQIPPRYLDKSLQDYKALSGEKSQERACMRATAYVESFPNVSRGLLFAGPCGIGKTHLSVAILKALVQEKQINGRFVDEAEFLRRLQYSYGPDSPQTEREVLLPLLEVDLLVWDDLGTGRPTEWVADTIRMVINHRYTYSKQTIFTTNRSLETSTRNSRPARPSEHSLAERITQQLFSRIMEMCEVVKIEGEDFRTVVHKASQDFQAFKKN